MFGVCFTSDASDPGSDMHINGPATIEAVGSGVAPAGCKDGGYFGLRTPNQWWLQARTADNHLWTIGVLGLGGNTPLVRTGDVVTLALDWLGWSGTYMYRDPVGQIQLLDAAGTPVLWAGSDAEPPSWLSFAPGDYACKGGTFFCADKGQKSVIATVNGSTMTLPPFGGASLGGYFVQVTMFYVELCGDVQYYFAAAAAKIPATTGP
jgi:hypothetical protein